MASHSPHLLKLHELFTLLRQRKKELFCELDGENLHIADVVAVAQYGCGLELSQDPKIAKTLQDSVDVLFDHLENGWYVYGVNTGFGGSADSRTQEVIKLQASLMQHTQSGILENSTDSQIPKHSMPATWVKDAMVLRCNSTLRGHSAVSFPVLKAMTALLKHNLTPAVSLRGSVSASGDLMPLAYVAGSLEGNPDLLLETNSKVLSSDKALQNAGLAPIAIGPKEGLSLINGTLASAGLGALVIAEAHSLAFLTQVLTGAAVETLGGSSESFHPFIARTRPHPGQIECARNIHFLLRGSHLARDVLVPKDHRREDLVQDRYSLRSAPQWIGPQLEDLLLADQQISIELNSLCDNPLVDSETRDIYYGCNFQAVVVTSAMEKARLSLQMFGRMLFSQSTEIIDPHLSGGLPANLAADDPSLSFTMKGVDVNMAAYMAELSYVANPMSSHVQAAEMYNQSVSSMALASARMSHSAIDILTKMAACDVFVVCQALDLRALHTKFLCKVVGLIKSLAGRSFASLENHKLVALQSALKAHIGPAWGSTGNLDLLVRCESLVASSVPIVASIYTEGSLAELLEWQSQATTEVFETWKKSSEAFIASPRTAELLGKGSQVLYQFVRHEFGVPFHRGFVEHPTYDNSRLDGRDKKTIGGWISMIHASIQNGSLSGKLLSVVGDGLLAIKNGVTGVSGVNGTNGTDKSLKVDH